jgi:hypothetical protein
MITKWSFLTEEYINKFCELGKGKETCRYLTMGSGWDCEKGTSLGRYLDERVEANTMNAQGDNCPGAIGFLCDGKLIGDLKGKKVSHEESMPSYHAMGTVEELSIDDGMLCLKAKWDDGNEFTPSIAMGYISIYSNGGNIIVSATFPGGNTWTFYPN